MANTTCVHCTQPIEPNDDVRFDARGALHAYPCGERRLFAYGTLRTGGPLEGWLPAHAYREAATLHGYALHYPKGHRSFPYLVPGAPDDVVHGELIVVQAGDDAAVEAYERTLRMETNAGYVATTVDVHTKQGVQEAVTCVWKYRRLIGPKVQGGDWTQVPEWIREDHTGFAGASVSPARDDDRITLYLFDHDSGEPTQVGTIDGTVLWEGWSSTALTRWARENNAHIEYHPDHRRHPNNTQESKA